MFKSASSTILKISSRDSISTLTKIVEKTQTPFKASGSLQPMCSGSTNFISPRETAKQKRLVLRDYKAKVDSLEEEELKKKIFDQRQKQLQIEGG